MPELEQLHAGQVPAVLAFQPVNRAYFVAPAPTAATSYSSHFPGWGSALLAEQEALHPRLFDVLVADDGSVLGRFNLYDFA